MRNGLTQITKFPAVYGALQIIHPFFDFVIEDDEVYYVDYGGMKRPIEKKKLKEIINDL